MPRRRSTNSANSPSARIFAIGVEVEAAPVDMIVLASRR
jgi:hypothetical protein